MAQFGSMVIHGSRWQHLMNSKYLPESPAGNCADGEEEAHIRSRKSIDPSKNAREEELTLRRESFGDVPSQSETHVAALVVVFNNELFETTS